jgi:type III secretion system (T3SS) SseB-like protein
VPELITGGLGDPTDRGDADPRVAAALGAFAAGDGSEHATLAALAGARLLVPVVAMLAEAAPAAAAPAGAASPEAASPGAAPAGGAAVRMGGGAGAGRGLRREKASEMALPILLGSDGRRAVLAFTCLPALAGWRPDARPVPVTASQVWQAGAEEASAVVIDVAGPVPFAVDGARLAALAAGRPPPLPHNDPDMQALAAAAMPGEPPVAGLALLPGGDDSDLTIQVTLTPGYGPSDARAQAAIQRAVERIVAGGGGRVRRGITVAVRTGAASTGAASTGAQPAGIPPAEGP